MRQSKKLILLAALVVGISQSAEGATVSNMALTSPTPTAQATTVPAIGASINGTVTGEVFLSDADDWGCMALGLPGSPNAFVTSEGLNPITHPVLGAFPTAAEFWANITQTDPEDFTNVQTGAVGDSNSIPGLTGQPAAANFSANMTRDLVVGCGERDTHTAGDALTTLHGDAYSVTLGGGAGGWTFLVEVVAEADWFTQIQGLELRGTVITASSLTSAPQASTDLINGDFKRPEGVIALNATVGTADKGATAGVPIDQTDISGTVQVINFTTGNSTYWVAGIGDVISANVTSGALSEIAGSTASIHANFPTLGEIPVFVTGTTPGAQGNQGAGNVFLLQHTIAADDNGQVLDNGQTIGQTATFFVRDSAGNTSSYDPAQPNSVTAGQKHNTATPFSAIVNVAIANKSYSLVAADFQNNDATEADRLALGAAGFTTFSRGATGDNNGLQMSPLAAATVTPPTILNLTVNIAAGGTAELYYANNSRDHNHATLGEGHTRTVNLTNVVTGTIPAGATGGFVTGTLTDGPAAVTISGTDAAGNSLVPLAFASTSLAMDLTPPTVNDVSPVANSDDPVTDPGQATFRGLNSELLSSSTLQLTCDNVSADATSSSVTSPNSYDWAEDSTAAQEFAAIVGGTGTLSSSHFPADGAVCSWAWTGVDVAGNAGALTSGTLSQFQSGAAAEIPSTITLTPSGTTHGVGTAYTLNVQLTDAGNLAVFGAANLPDDQIVTLTAHPLNDAAGACAYETGDDATCTLVFSGTDVTDGGDNSTATVPANAFGNGDIGVTITNTRAGTVNITAVLDAGDGVDGDGSLGHTGNITASVGALSKLLLSSESATAGADFWVEINVADTYRNRRTGDADFVEISTNSRGATIPTSAIKISEGTGGFWASTDHVGTQTIWARSLNNAGVEGSLTHEVAAIPALTAVGGADVPEDNGNFIYLNMSGVAPEAELVRIWRDVEGVGGTPVSYATFDPPNGVTDVTVIVYTPDNEATSYLVTQETARNASGSVTATSNKQAFASTEGIDSYYELMAETMMKSKQAVSTPDAPIFAILTPDAISLFDGVAPSFKVGDNGLESSGFVSTEPIRAIDNLAPAPVQQLRAVDTPADAGGSITVSWQKSVDDRQLIQNTAQALGANTGSTVPGVLGYNIYRKVGTGDFEMVSSVPAGETSFEDKGVFNALRYTYTVSPFDADNVTPSELERTSMAIRNNVKDASGSLVMGLFGADNSVGFDDFFIFADFFGQTYEDVSFDPAFDLHPNNRIDLDDFFVFADYFGRGVQSSGRVVPMLAGLNSDVSLTLDAGEDLPSVGEELTVTVNLEDYIELRGYGLSLNYDSAVLEFVGSKVENDNLLGEGSLAQPTVIPGQDGKASVVAFGETVVDGDLGLSLVFRAKTEIESSYIEIADGQLRDGSFGVNDLRGPVSVMVETRPEVYALRDNYPNPFNPETMIKYQLPEAGFVTLEIYNMLGQVVRTLVSDHRTAGRYSVRWDATNDKGQALSSGMYFYRVQAGQEFQQTKKMLLLK